ncbi:hypothetical protein B0H10DRAFT_2211408 [Mycena sp. CBHHK59/15]|nr:hypothetical protein B0H10DRAFT_2211408 [Mycena sp. CBHHK59/15]
MFVTDVEGGESGGNTHLVALALQTLVSPDIEHHAVIWALLAHINFLAASQLSWALWAHRNSDPDVDILSDLSDSSEESYHPETKPEPSSDSDCVLPAKKRQRHTLPEAAAFYGPASRWPREFCKKARRRSLSKS